MLHIWGFEPYIVHHYKNIYHSQSQLQMHQHLEHVGPISQWFYVMEEWYERQNEGLRGAEDWFKGTFDNNCGSYLCR